jgi:hypothetical protein
MSPIAKLIAKLTGSPKAASQTVQCPECQHEFEVKQDSESGDWRTDESTTSTTGDNGSEEDDENEFEDKKSMNPKSRSAREAEIAQKILATAKQRDFVGAKPHEIGPQKCIEIVADKRIVENSSPADLLAKALIEASKSRK